MIRRLLSALPSAAMTLVFPLAVAAGCDSGGGAGKDDAPAEAPEPDTTASAAPAADPDEAEAEAETAGAADGTGDDPTPAAGDALPPRGDGDRASPNGRAEGTVGGVPVVVTFGRPGVKGREIFGGLIPYGKVWRTGANEATAIRLGADARVEGQPLSAGVYGLFTIPGEDSWTVVFNRVAKQWGAYDYDAGQDALRVEVTPTAHETTEQMDIVVDDEALRIRWADVEVPVSIAAAR